MIPEEILYRRIAEGDTAGVAAALHEQFADAQTAADEIAEQLLILGDHYDELDKLPDWAERCTRRLCDAFGALDGYELSATRRRIEHETDMA